MKVERIYFRPDEVRALAMGLGMIIDTFNSQNPDTPWTPEARKYQKEIVGATKSAAEKLEKFTGIKCDLPPYFPGDETEFLTKES